MDATLTEHRPGFSAGHGTGERGAIDAVEAAIWGLEDRPAGLIVLSSRLSAGSVERVVASRLRGEVPFAGMTASGVISREGLIERGAVALAFERGICFGVAARSGSRLSPHAAARGAAAEAVQRAGCSRRGALALMMVDTRLGDQAAAVAGAYEVLGPAVTLVGGGAGGDEPAQFADGVHDHSVVIAVIGNLDTVASADRDGCRRLPIPAIATRTDGRTIFELDGRPAAEVYLERLGVDGADLGREQFHELAVTHPLAQPEPSGNRRLRHVLGRGPAGELECATHIPENSAIEFTRQQLPSIVSAGREAVGEALAGLGGRPPRAAMLFDCAGRKSAAGSGLTEQVDATLGGFGEQLPPLIGMFSHGEIHRSRGAKGDRNHAIVASVIA